MQIVFLDLASVDSGDLDQHCLQQVAGQWQLHAHTELEQIRVRIAAADVVVTNKVPLTAELINAAPNLKLICVAATGTNNVDLVAARRRGIPVCNARAYATPSVVQHVFCLLLMLLRRIPQYTQAVQTGLWQLSPQFCLLDFPIEELTGKRLGIVGYGELGRAVAHVAKAFGMPVLIAQRESAVPQTDRVPLAELLTQVDILSLHCPLTEHNRHMIGKTQLALMKPGAILINTARGGLVEEAALLESLSARHLGGAGIDVLAIEPPEADNVLLAARLPNLIITPHIAWASRQARQRLLQEVIDNILGFVEGQPRHVVNH